MLDELHVELYMDVVVAGKIAFADRSAMTFELASNVRPHHLFPKQHDQYVHRAAKWSFKKLDG